MNKNDQDYLAAAFRHEINYIADDPTEPIDPLTYIAPDDDSCLHIAARRGDLRAIQILVDAGLDINLQGDLGYTPLHWAKNGGHKDVIDFLLKHGADPNIKNEFGVEALPSDKIKKI